MPSWFAKMQFRVCARESRGVQTTILQSCTPLEVMRVGNRYTCHHDTTQTKNQEEQTSSSMLTNTKRSCFEWALEYKRRYFQNNKVKPTNSLLEKFLNTYLKNKKYPNGRLHIFAILPTECAHVGIKFYGALEFSSYKQFVFIAYYHDSNTCSR